MVRDSTTAINRAGGAPGSPKLRMKGSTRHAPSAPAHDLDGRANTELRSDPLLIVPAPARRSGIERCLALTSIHEMRPRARILPLPNPEDIMYAIGGRRKPRDEGPSSGYHTPHLEAVGP